MQTQLNVTATPFNFLEKDYENIKKLKALSHPSAFSFIDSIKYHKHIESFYLNL